MPKSSPFASWLGAIINPQCLELLMSRTNFHGPKDVRDSKVLLQLEDKFIIMFPPSQWSKALPFRLNLFTEGNQPSYDRVASLERVYIFRGDNSIQIVLPPFWNKVCSKRKEFAP